MWVESSNYSLAKGTSSSPSKHAGIGPVAAGIGPVPVGIGPVPASYNMFTRMHTRSALSSLFFLFIFLFIIIFNPAKGSVQDNLH